MTGTLLTVGGRNVLRFERRLAHSPEKVWRAITEPAEMTHWFPADLIGDRAQGEKIRFVFRGEEGPPMDGEIIRWDPPRLFEYTWDTDGLRFELRPDGRGCLLIFTHTFDDRAGAASFASGWDGCLEALGMVLDGKPGEGPGRYPERHDEYVAVFGLGEGSVEEGANGWTVRFERQLPHPINKVWPTLIESDESTPGAIDIKTGDTPPLRLTNGYVPAGAITAIEPSRLLEYAWLFEDEQVGRVRWEFSEPPMGARIVLTQTVPGRLKDQRITALAAWHTHLELLAEHLRGNEICPWPTERTEELRAHYTGVIG